jgi:excisionase family DNA binding protein
MEEILPNGTLVEKGNGAYKFYYKALSNNMSKKHTLKEKKYKRLLTIEEASKILNIKVSRLRQAVFRREINYVKLGALVRFREDDLQIFITKNLKSFNQSKFL